MFHDLVKQRYEMYGRVPIQHPNKTFYPSTKETYWGQYNREPKNLDDKNNFNYYIIIIYIKFNCNLQYIFILSWFNMS